MAITNRKGLSSALVKSKLLPGELAVTTDTGELYFCYSAGNVKKVATEEDVREMLNASSTAYVALQQLIADLELNPSELTNILANISELQQENTDLVVVINKNTSRIKDIYINVKDYGVVGDGSDETSKMQTALNDVANTHGVFYVPSDMTVTVDQLTLSGKSNFALKVDGWLKRKDNSAITGGMLLFINCSYIDILDTNGDGNVANNGVTIDEHKHIYNLTSCTDVTIHKLTGINLTGDLLYIDGANGGTPARIQGNNISGYSNNTGRNTISIVKGHDMNFNNILSVGVGAIGMPSGVDVEPNTSADDCSNINFSNIYVLSQGTGGFTLTNNFGSKCKKITASNVIVEKISTDRPSVNHTNTGITVNQCDFVKIKNAIVREIQPDATKLSTLGLWINGGYGIDIECDVDNVYKGSYIGYDTKPKKLCLKGNIRNTGGIGIQISLLDDSEINVNITDQNLIGYADGAFLTLNSGSVLNNVYFKGIYRKITYGWKGVWIVGTHTNLTFDIDFIGMPESDFFVDSNVALLYKIKPMIWHNLNLLNGWTVASGNDYTPAYAKDINGIIHFRGLASGSGTSGTEIASPTPTGVVGSKNVIGNKWVINVYGQVLLLEDVTGSLNFNLNYIP